MTPLEQTHERMLRALDTWLRGGDPADASYEAARIEQEAAQQKEQDWLALEHEARQFVARYGAAAMLRCVSEALK